MDPTTSVVAATDVAKTVAEKLPFTSLIRSILGPASDKFAERCRDSVRVYRYGQQLKLLEKAERMATDAGFTPNAVPIKLLFPLLDGASLEENEALHTMWAALLANAANPATPDLVHPSFAGVLKQLSPHDAAVLVEEFGHIACVLDQEGCHSPDRWQLFERAVNTNTDTADDGAIIGLSPDRWYQYVQSLSTLEALGLIHGTVESGQEARWRAFTHSLTPRGFEFLKACQEPPKEI